MKAPIITRCGVALATGAIACVNINDDPAIIVWEAQLTPSIAYPDLSGQVAAVSDASGTAVGIAIDGAGAGAALTWGVRLGTCETPGTQIGPDTDYPELTADLDGSASGETHLGPRLTLDGTYHAELRASDGSRIACGDLEAP